MHDPTHKQLEHQRAEKLQDDRRAALADRLNEGPFADHIFPETSPIHDRRPEADKVPVEDLHDAKGSGSVGSQ